MTETRKTINIEQALARFPVSKRTLYYWIASGRVERTGPRMNRQLYVDTIESCMAQKGQHSK